MTVSPLSLTELYVWWSSNTIVALAALGIALYATWRAQRTNRKLRELIRWAQGVDPLIGDAEVEPADDAPTDDFAKLLIREAFDEPPTSPDLPRVEKPPVIREAPTNPAMPAIRPTPYRRPAGATAVSAIDDEWQRRRREVLGPDVTDQAG